MRTTPQKLSSSSPNSLAHDDKRIFSSEEKMTLFKKDPAIKKPNIAFVAIDCDHDKRNDLHEKPIETQIEICVQEIEKTCLLLAKKEADGSLAEKSMWVVSLGDYVIEEEDLEAVSPEGKKKFKDAMKLLTKKFPQLTVIAGTIITLKEKPPDEAKKLVALIDARYKETRSVEEHSYAQFLAVKEKVLNQNQGMTVARTTCFVFQQGENIWTRCKTTPRLETLPVPRGMNNLVFHPGRIGNIVKDLPHPNKLESLSIGIEICIEHGISMLRQMKKKVMLHLILSDHIGSINENFCGVHNVHIDSINKANFISTKGADPQKIRFYIANMFSPENAALISEQDAIEQIVKMKADIMQASYPMDKSVIGKFSQLFGMNTVNVHGIKNQLPPEIMLQYKEIIKAEEGLQSYSQALANLNKMRAAKMGYGPGDK